MSFMNDSNPTRETASETSAPAGLNRRRFLQVFSAVGAGAVALPWLAACGSFVQRRWQLGGA